jgi:hypothetical protein
MARQKGSLGMKTLVKFYEMHMNGEKVDKSILKQIAARGADKVELGKKKVKNVSRKVAKPLVAGSVKLNKMWREIDNGFRFQVENCTQAEANKLVKSFGARIAVVASVGKSRRKTFVFKKEFSDTADARRWARKNGFTYTK